MISIFGIVSIAIALISVAAIVLHNRVMGKRAPVDAHLTQLEDLLRDRMEMLYRYSRPGTQLYELCEQYIDLDLESILKALPDIGRAFDEAWDTGNLIITEPLDDEPEPQQDDYVTMAGLESNAHAIQETTAALNQAIKNYNSFITDRPPEALMAKVLGLTTEEPYHF